MTHQPQRRRLSVQQAKGGGGTPAMPGVSAPPPPPASATSVEVTQAKIDQKQQLKARSGINQSILAGTGAADTGALGGGTGGKNTLLGGG